MNIVGGVKVTEPAIDLAVALAIYSAFRNKPLPKNQVVFGELGLGGEVRSVQFTDRRLSAIEKLGFESVLCPTQKNQIKSKLQIKFFKNINQIEHL